jgi:pyrimidine-nucleoside phosphorylase
MMVDIGEHAERDVIALLSDMNQPLGKAVGNAIEVIEAVHTLQDAGPADFREHCLVVASNMLLLSGKYEQLDSARADAEASLRDGRALHKFEQLVQAQGGDVSVLEDLSKLPAAPVKWELESESDGSIHQIHAREVGLTAMELGAGRAKKGDSIDHSVGIEILNNVGDIVARGDTLAIVHACSKADARVAGERLRRAHVIKPEPVEELPLFYDTVRA